jgi:hypothetical protein
VLGPDTFVLLHILACKTTSQKEKKSSRNAFRIRFVGLVSLCAVREGIPGHVKKFFELETAVSEHEDDHEYDPQAEDDLEDDQHSTGTLELNDSEHSEPPLQLIEINADDNLTTTPGVVPPKVDADVVATLASQLSAEDKVVAYYQCHAIRQVDALLRQRLDLVLVQLKGRERLATDLPPFKYDTKGFRTSYATNDAGCTPQEKR